MIKKSRKKILISFSIFILIGVISTLFCINYKEAKIDYVLKTDSYEYLKPQAKEYIKKVYKETGEVLLTEKSKKVNEPYLNPKYESYLQLSDEAKENVSLIPTPYIVDYVYSNSSQNQTFPSTYNLENVDGKKYTSEMYNQGNLGTCWAFATVENAESHLMIKKGEPRNENSTRFSVRQLDYAASNDGITNYANPWGGTALSKGGNFIYATTLMANGLSLVPDSYMPYNEKLDKKPLHEIHNYNNALYEVDGTVNLPNFGKVELEATQHCNELNGPDFDACYDETSQKIYTEYKNIIKEGIIEYGGIYLGAYDPTGVCAAVNSDGHYVLDPNNTCFPMGSTAAVESGHAMQIIGWDDNYKYSYCKGAKHTSTVDGTCKSGILTEGTGAWIVKNSWGVASPAAYTYLTYDSIDSNFVTFAYITSLTDMKNKNWDNVYNSGLIKSHNVSKLTQTFEKKFDNQEKLQKIKFHTVLMNQQYSITVKADGKTYSITNLFKTKYPGLYTVDVSAKNIVLKSGKFDVIITSNGRSINENSISVFTKNLDNKPLIITEEPQNISSNEFTIYSETRNIPSDSKIEYELYEDTTKLENVLQVKNNIVSANNINTEVTLIKKIKPGSYKLVQKFGNTESNVTLNVGTILTGAGTEENPYKIYTEEDLKYIYNNLDSYYKLENDIKLTNKWIPIGTKENPFTGSFDGNNHKIIDLQINDPTLEYAGLFGYVKDSNAHQTFIKNIYLVNPNIIAKKYVGGLIGGIDINNTGKQASLIDSIYIIGGNIEGEYANGLVADISGYYELTINNIFSSATIKGKSHSSLIRFSYNQYNSTNGTTISNIQNIGIMYDNNNSNYKTSLISANYFYYYNLSNYISTGYSKKINSINKFYDTPVSDANDNFYNQGYVLNRTNGEYQFPSTINKVTDIVELKNINKYRDWGENFKTYWIINTEQGITRIPILKGVALDYTEPIEDIQAKIDNDINLSDYISSQLITRRLKVTTKDTDIIKISNKYKPSEAYPYEITISPLKYGTATIHVVSDYDGFEDDIVINIPKENLTLTYHNGPITSTQNIKNGIATKLIKNTFTKEHYTFKEWNTSADGNGTKYSDLQEVTLKEDLDLYAIWEANKYNIKFTANGGTGTMNNQVFVYDKLQKITKNIYKKEGFNFKEWNTKTNGTGISYADEQEIKLNNDLILYAIWQEETNIENKTKDLETYYDGKYHTIKLDLSIPDYQIKYSLDKSYNLDKIPEFKEIGEYTINYKITKQGYKDLIGSNKVKIYGIKKINETIKDNTIIVKDKSLNNLKNKIEIYSKNNVIKLLDIDQKDVSSDIIKTGYTLRININNEKNYDYKLSLLGDVSGDSSINSADLLKIRLHLLEKNKLSDVYFLAGDINGDDAINSADLFRIRQHLLNIKVIS